MTLSKIGIAIAAAGIALPGATVLAEGKVYRPIDEVSENRPDTEVSEIRERVAEGSKGTMSDTDGATVETTNATARPKTAEETRELLGSEATGMFFAEETSRITVADMMHRSVISTTGEALGDITRVVEIADRNYFVVEHGGFLGLGDSELVIPVDRTALNGEAIVVAGMTDAELDAMAEYDPDAEVKLNVNYSIDLKTLKQ